MMPTSGIPYRKGKIVLAVLLCLGCGACTDGESEKDVEARESAAPRALNSLPYVVSSRVREENRGLRGVVLHDADQAYQGLNLYGSLTRSEALLRTMDGELVQTWSAEGVFTDREDFPLADGILQTVAGPIAPGLTVAEIHGAYLLAIESMSGLVKLDRQSRVVFALNNNAHHDVDIAADGSIYVLTAVPRWIETGGGKLSVIDDVIERISPNGDLMQSFSVMEILGDDPDIRPLLTESLRYAKYWFANLEQWQQKKIEARPTARSAYEAMFQLHDEAFIHGTRNLDRRAELYVLYITPADILHSNTLEVLSGRPDGLWDDGHVLVSVRNLDLVAVLDLNAHRVVWWWGPGSISRQHQPSLLANGNLLIFDNGTATGRSRVIELDPATYEIVWSYGETSRTRFFCAAMGGAQGLPNGNVLITESAAGRAFEVDRSGRVVWNFFNPGQGFNPFEGGSNEEVIEAIYRLVRVEAAVPDSLVEGG